jgi:hypothetical protein
VSLRSKFRVVVSVSISAYKQCSVCLYPRLFVGGLTSCLRYLCLFAHRGVQHILYLCFCFVSSCVAYVASFSGLSTPMLPVSLDCPLLCCQFLWIVHSYVASFSGLSTPMLLVSLDCSLLCC